MKLDPNNKVRKIALPKLMNPYKQDLTVYVQTPCPALKSNRDNYSTVQYHKISPRIATQSVPKERMNMTPRLT